MSSYIEYYGLKELPFENTADIRFFYFSKEHEEALARLEYVIRNKKQLSMVTGEYGSGKTLLCNYLPTRFPADKYQFVYLGNPFLPASEIVYTLVSLLSRKGGSI